MNTNLAKFPPKNLFSKFFFFHFFFFPNTRNSILKQFSPLFTLWKFFFGHLDFFSHKTLRFFFASLHRHLTFFFLDFRKNLANVHPRTIEKFLSNIECNWHRNSLTNRNYSKQYNRIHRYKIHTHAHFFWSKEIWAANSEFNRVSRENSA